MVDSKLAEAQVLTESSELKIARALSPGSSDEQLRNQLLTMQQNLQQEPILDGEQEVAQSQTAATQLKSPGEIADVTRGLIRWLQHGAKDNSTIAGELTAIDQWLAKGGRNVYQVIEEIKKIVAKDLEITPKAQAEFNKQSPEVMQDIEAIKTVADKHPWAKDILEKIMGKKIFERIEEAVTRESNKILNEVGQEAAAITGTAETHVLPSMSPARSG
jgi:glutamyl/glutaminyl-tRNA synthetase